MVVQTTQQIESKFNSKFLFYGLLLYCVIFYSQIAARIPALAPFRMEFVVGSILLAVIFFKILKGHVQLNENRLHYAALIFFLYCGITIPFAFIKSTALNEYIRYLKFFSIYLMMISCIADEKRLRIFMYVYLSCIALLFVEPFFLSLQGKGFRYNNHMMRLYGITGFFAHPNQLGGITSANIPFFYYMIFYHKSKLSKLLFIFLLLSGIWVILLTQSRTGFLGIVIFGVFIWILSKNKFLIFIGILLSSIVLWQMAPEQTKKRFLTFEKTFEVLSDTDDTFVGNEELGSMNSRWILIKRSLIIFSENPIFGVGMNCFPSINGRRWNHWFQTHNLYTQALSELGLVGTLLFAYIIFIMFRNIHQTKTILEANDDTSIIYYLNKALNIFLSVRLTIGVSGHDLYRNWWWIAGGLTVINYRILKQKYHLDEKKA